MQASVRQKKTSRSGGVEGHLSRTGNNRLVTGNISILLLALVWIVFGQTLGHDFVYYDDNEYVYENSRITRGLSLENVQWAFSHTHAGNWHPLTTISHMLDCQLYGLQPWGHHLTNVLLHSAAAIFLFLALLELTGARWPSGFVAAVFAIHPLHVESVAWVAERKDVLSGMFFMLTLWAYARYARSSRPSTGRYITVIVLFALGLMCKPTLVTLPFVLLLLDYWPLRRFAFQSTGSKSAGIPGKQVGVRSSEGRSWGRLPAKPIQYLLIEKIPFFVLSVGSCVATLLAQEESLATIRQLTLEGRIGNAMTSYVAYLGQMIWPMDLTAFYPFPPGGINIAQVIVAAAVLMIVSVVFFLWRSRYPFLWIGWLWFLGVLVPMIGIVQVGEQSRADRYTYLAQIGLYAAVTWLALELVTRWPKGREILIAVAVLIVTALTADSYLQTRAWQNSETLWNHAFAHTTNNHSAHSNLGGALVKMGRLDEAISHFQKALEIYPDYPEHNNLGDALLKKGQVDEAVVHFRKALKIYPDCPEAHANLGNAFISKGNWAEAIAAFEAALRVRPNYSNAHNNMGISLAEAGKPDEALAQFHEALRIDGEYRDARCNLALLLAKLGRRDEAIAQLREALRLRPNDEGVKTQLRELGVER